MKDCNHSQLLVATQLRLSDESPRQSKVAEQRIPLGTSCTVFVQCPTHRVWQTSLQVVDAESGIQATEPIDPRIRHSSLNECLVHSQDPLNLAGEGTSGLGISCTSTLSLAQEGCVGCSQECNRSTTMVGHSFRTNIRVGARYSISMRLQERIL
jgi:hypothetical protein